MENWILPLCLFPFIYACANKESIDPPLMPKEKMNKHIPEMSNYSFKVASTVTVEG